LDGNPGSIIFEAAHRTPSTMIYWHLNEQFLGTTKDIHQVAVSPQQGSYTLTIVDENGERLSRTIRINRRD
jgi:penicillin-binding protein 1C